MKSVFIVIVLCIMLSSLSIAQSDSSSSTKTPEVMLWGGLALPYLPAEYKTYWKSGYNIGAGFGYSLDPGSVGYGAFYLTMEYGRTNFDSKKYTDSLHVLHPADSAIAGPVKMFNAMVNFKATFSSTKKSIAPYFLLGVGYMNYSQAEIYITPNTLLSTPGVTKGGVSWSFGVGIEVPVNDNIRGFVQAKSLLGVTDPSRQYFPITAGITYVL